MVFLKGFVRVMDRINRIMYWIVGVLVFLATALVFLDVILRYIFNTVTSFGFDATLWFTLIIALLAGGYITQIHEHITVDILYLKMGQSARRFIRYVTYAMIVFLALVMITYGGERVLYYFEKGSKSIGGMRLYLWVKWTIVPISGVLLLLQTISEFIKEIYYQVKGTFLVPPIPKMQEELGLAAAVDEEEGEK